MPSVPVPCISGDNDESVAEGSASGEDVAAEPCIVCLAASAGGLEAFQEFLGAAKVLSQAGRPGPKVAFVVIVHLSPDFKSLMPDLLSRYTSMPVQAAQEDTAIEANRVYIIPPGKNMTIAGGRLHLQSQDRSPGTPLNLPVDLFLESLAADQGQRSIAIILSGTGSDGSRGIRSVKESGGVVLAQTPESAKFDGMPSSAIQTGLVDYDGSPTLLAARVESLLAHPLSPLRAAGESVLTREDAPIEGTAQPEDDRQEQEVAEIIDRIVRLIHTEIHIDVSYFRHKMLRRRIERRMSLQGIETFPEYHENLRRSPEEVAQLGQDLLIGVTSFYRDREAFQQLADKGLQTLLLGSAPEQQLRIWVTACSAGHEVYSIAMELLEAMRRSGVERKIKIFATDVDQRALERASRGVYSMSEVTDIPVALLGRYFEQRGSEYCVAPHLREHIIFACHNVVTDPPFMRMHLVSCRNLLIYLHSGAQQRVLRTLCGSLVANEGLLFLGAAEEPTTLGDQLTTVDAPAKLYRRSHNAMTEPVKHARLHEPVSVISSMKRWERSPAESQAKAQAQLMRAALETLVEDESKTAVLIDQRGHFIDILADPHQLFQMPRGKPTTDLGQILGLGIVSAITMGQQRLRQDETQVSYLVPQPGDDTPDLAVHLHRLQRTSPNESEPVAPIDLLLLQHIVREQVAPTEVASISPESAERVAALEHELRHVKENLQATIEELQASSEEQQSTNEELMASNEELQSTNEELHSVNEELYTVNGEYQSKNQELQQLTVDLNQLLHSTDIGTLYLDGQLRIRKFTSHMNRLLPLKSADLERPIADLAHALDFNLHNEAMRVLETQTPIEREFRDPSGAWFMMRMTPCAATSSTGNGVLATFVDVSRIKNAEETARTMGSELRTANETLTHQADQLESLFSIVAHDLRRPVASIDGLLKLAEKKLSNDNPQAAREHLRAGIQAASSLRNMLHDLTDMARHTHAEPSPEQVELRSWSAQVMAPLRTRAEEQGVRLQWIADPDEICFAESAARGIVNNLVENALLHGSGSDQPQIDVIFQNEGEYLRITVIDNGQGIAPEHHERVFELFRRLNPTETEGSGVGLVAVRRFAQRAGGSVRVTSEPGAGARFVAELPVHAGSPSESPAQHDILIVDDDPLDVELIAPALAGHTVQQANTLAEAAACVRKQAYALVILDLSLPDGDGLKLLHEMGELNAQTPVLVVSGQTERIRKTSEDTDPRIIAAISKRELNQLGTTIETALA